MKLNFVHPGILGSLATGRTSLDWTLPSGKTRIKVFSFFLRVKFTKCYFLVDIKLVLFIQREKCISLLETELNIKIEPSLNECLYSYFTSLCTIQTNSIRQALEEAIGYTVGIGC